MENKVITVDHTEKNDYGDLQVWDSEGNKHKIGNKRSKLFDLFHPEAKIELVYKSFKDKDYIADAKPVIAKSPEAKSINHAVSDITDKVETNLNAQAAFDKFMDALIAGKLNEEHEAVQAALSWGQRWLNPIAVVESVEEAFK